jgi:hypothetical protein
MRRFSVLLSFIISIFLTTDIFAQISGSVFRDFNSNGIKDNSATYNEPFVAGITVKAFSAANVQMGSTKITSASGTYSFTAVEIPATTKVRIEFSGLTIGDASSFTGTGNGSSVQFATAGATVNYGVSTPDDYWNSTTQPTPKLLNIVHGQGDINHTNSSNITFGIIQTDNGATGRTPTKVSVATQSQVGSLWGMGYQKSNDRFFFSSFLKRHVGIGPRGIGGIYMANLSGANYALTGGFSLQGVVPSNTATAIDLGAVTRVTTNDNDNELSTGTDIVGRDIDAFAKACKIGFGDIDVDDKNQQLVMVNLNQRSLVTLDLSTNSNLDNGTQATLGPLTKSFDILTLPGAPSCNNGQLRPFALKIYKGRGYLGAVCDASATPRDSTNLAGYILSFDPTNISAGFTTEITLTFNYRTSTSNGNTNRWHSWANVWSDVIASGFYRYPQPLISDLEFDENGGLNIAITDRFGHQMAPKQTIPLSGSATTITDPRISGDILHACRVGNTWVMEGAEATCTVTNAVDANDGYGDGQTVGAFEYFNDASGDAVAVSGRGEFGQGALAKIMGTSKLLNTIIDPAPTPGGQGGIYFFSGGIHWYDVNTGSWNEFVTLYDGDDAGAPEGTYMKGNGMGDIEFALAPAPLQIGNRIWLDTNGDGVQGADETTVGVPSGTTVTLRSPGVNGIYGDGDDQTWTTTTDAIGNYYFSALSSADNRKPATWTGVGNTILQGYDYRIEVATPTGVQVTKSNTALNSFDNIDNDALANGANAIVTFNTGNTNHNFDIGFKPQASIGNNVWRDDDKDGIQDLGEPGVAGVTVTLYQNGADGASGTADDIVIGTTVTDAYGMYLFDNLTPTTNAPTRYNVGFTLPTNYQFTTQTNTQAANGNTTNVNDGATEANGNDANVTTGRTGSWDLSAGEAERGADAGIIFNTPPVTQSVGDRVWLDNGAGANAGNGLQDAGEPGVAGVTVTLFNSAGIAVAATITDANGNYLFNNVPVGTGYTVGFTPPVGFIFTTKDAGGNDASDSDVNTAAGATFGRTDVFNVTAGQNITTIDAGLIAQATSKASLGDKVWHDINRDGVQDAGEPGIAGVIVQLIAADGVTVLATTTTDAFGNYIFPNLDPGNYRVKFDNVSGLQRTSQNSTLGAIPDATDSDADATGLSPIYILVAGEKNMSVDAGYYSTQPLTNVGALGDKVWNDLNGDGVQSAGEPGVDGITVTLYNSTGAAVATTTTDINGNYLFPGLTPGNYSVGFSNLPTGFNFTGQDKGADDALDNDANTATGRTVPVAVVGGATNSTLDAGIRQGVASGLGSIGNKVWWDVVNANNVQDAGEVGVPGVTVNLLDYGADGAAGGGDDGPTRTATTNALGEYMFTGLPAGNYVVQFTNLPVGSTTVTQNSGANDNIDSDGSTVANATAVSLSTTGVISLAAGEDNLTVDLGIVNTAKGSFGNRVWYDNGLGAGGVAHNGEHDGAETGVAGVTVTLVNAAGQIVDRTGIVTTTPITTTTDANGYYSFADLTAGVAFAAKFTNIPAGFDFTNKIGVGSGDDNRSDPDIVSGLTSTVTIVANTHNITLDAGLVGTRAALGNFAWSDLNNNGTQDAGEPGVAGVTVSLYRPGFGLDGIVGNGDDALPVASMITDAKGEYFFSNLIPGDYQVEFTTIPTGMIFTQQNLPGDNQNNTNSDAVPANGNGRTGTITLSAGEVDLTVDAGLTVPRPATIGSRVWADIDVDGIQDESTPGIYTEPGVAGVLVTLYNSSNQPIGSAITDGDGNWEITKVPTGIGYYVIFTSNLPNFDVTGTPAGNPAWTEQNNGANGAAAIDGGTESVVDSDVNVSGANPGRTGTFSIVSGNNFPNIDAGIINWPLANLLPIKLLSFTAIPRGNAVSLDWSIDNQLNVNKYEVLYSKDGVDFSTILANVTATANTSAAYKILHSSPVAGINYYKIKTTEKDGAISYSEIRKVNFGKAGSITVYPNPAKDVVNITVLGSMINQAATITLLSVDGKIITQSKFARIGQTETIDVSKLSNGTYIIRVITEQEVINRTIEIIR